MTEILGVIAGLITGVASGSMGVGGGVLFVPILVVGFGFRQQVAQGTSLVAIIPTSIVGAITHHRYGNVMVKPAIWMAAGGVISAPAGALLALHMPREVLARAFGAFLLFSAYRMWPRGRRTAVAAAEEQAPGT